MKILCLSDTHNAHDYINLDNVDLSSIDTVVHAGDFSYTGELHVYKSLNDWLMALEIPNIVIVAGNHDISFQNDYEQAIGCFDSSIHILLNRAVTIDGVKFYGSPYTPTFGEGWAFNIPRNSEEMKHNWDLIPDDTEVLITHGPPAGILDANMRLFSCGCSLLMKRINELEKLKAHIFGHIHECAGRVSHTRHFVNAAICNGFYKPKNKPIVIEI